jgi:hypothetical protein
MAHAASIAIGMLACLTLARDHAGRRQCRNRRACRLLLVGAIVTPVADRCVCHLRFRSLRSYR